MDQRPSPIVNAGPASFVLFRDYADTVHDNLETIFNRDEGDSPPPVVPWKITFPLDGNTYETTFDAWIQEIGGITYSVGGEVVQTITLEVTTLPVTAQEPAGP